MYIKVTRSMFIDAFRDMGRLDQFSYSALSALYDYLTDNEEGIGTELDVIALCCDWAELTEAEIGREYGLSLDEARDRTVIIEIGNEAYLVEAF